MPAPLHLLRASVAAFFLLACTAGAQAPNSNWVFPSPTGNLLYQFDERGQRIPDFSHVGYRSGTAPLPDVSKAIESNRWVFVSPLNGDDTTNLQAAINQVSARSLNSNGFRGIVFLQAGEYQLSNTLKISAGGLVLKGVSDSASTGSRLRATAPRQYTLISVDGSGSRTTVSGTTHQLTQKLVPAGTRTFEVDSTNGLAVGHLVRIKRPSTANWIAAIDMDQLGPASGGDPDVVPWTEGSKDLYFDRAITRIEGRWITVDAPLPQTFEAVYGGGQISRYTWSRAENIGIEDLYGVSDHDGSGTDEEHAWEFITLRDVQHCWVRNITSQYFGYSAVSVNTGAKWITIADSQCLDPISLITGGRRYSFNNGGAELTLFVNDYARKGRHDFVFGSTVPGPNAFVHGTADTAYADTGPHHRWSVGGLFDLIDVNGDAINVQNRGNLGTGHGWAGAYMTVWNCEADSYRVRNPPMARNWLVGSVGAISSSSCCAVGADPPGTYDHSGASGGPVHPRSLYYGQLQQRLKWPFSEFREYWLGDVDQFAATNAAGESVTVDEGWPSQVQTAAGTNVVSANFDALAGNRWVAFTFRFGLAANEQVKAASLVLGLRAIGSASTDALYLDTTAAPLSFNSLGWSIATTGSTVETIEVDPALLADGRLNVALGDDTAVDFATLQLQVAPILPASTNTLAPVADAHVRGGTYASDNFGTDPTLQTKDVTASDVNRESFLRWDLAGLGGKLIEARVRLFCTAASQAGNENVAAFVSNDTWGETTLTFNNKPTSGKLFAQWLPVPGQAAEFVVTPFVTEALLGDGKLSLRVSAADDFGGLGNVSYAAREDATPTRRPQLILLFSNTPPILSHLTNYNGAANFPLGPLPFLIGDAETPAGNLVLSANSSNTNLVPRANIVFGGSSSNRTVTVTPAANQTGSALLTLTVSDGSLSTDDTFVVNFGTGNTPPTLSNLDDTSIPEGGALARPFTVSDPETAWTNLIVTAASSNPNLLPPAGLGLGFAGIYRVIYLTPAPDAFGTATITVTVSDGFLSASDSFVLTVTPVNDRPEFVEITSPEDGATIGAGAPFPITAEALDVDGNLARVEFFQGASRLGLSTNAPYTVPWPNPIPGSYSLTAVATDSNGLAVTSAPVHVTVAAPEATLVSTGAVWKYFDAMTDLGTTWRAPAFDDSAWLSGPAPLGFGDGDEATAVISNRARITTYFRRSIEVTNLAAIAQLTLNLLRDDGAVVYLNGAEVFRSNMPTGAIAWGTFAGATALAEDESTNFYPAVLSPWRLRPGPNTLAVEVHQNSTNSSDISFDLALTAAPPASQVLVPPGATWRYRDTGIAPPATWTQPLFDASGWAGGPARLGYGGDGETTLVSFGTNANAKHITTWFRRDFAVTDPSAFGTLELQFQRDDGVVFYLNGAEVLRDNMPAGSITAATLASSAVGTTNETRWFRVALNPSLLRPGLNVLAAEVHQAAADSSDLGFDSAVLAWPGAAAPSLIIRAEPSLMLQWPASATGYHLVTATNLASPVSWLPVIDPMIVSNSFSLLPLVQPTNTQRFFRLQSP
jgi:hypothetical protein